MQLFLPPLKKQVAWDYKTSIALLIKLYKNAPASPSQTDNNPVRLKYGLGRMNFPVGVNISYIYEVQKKAINYLDFEVDKLTRSIENVVSGDSFPTEISLLTKDEVKLITKNRGWEFDWKKELSFKDREVYKLTIANNPDIVQGIVSFRIEPDHIYMPLIESAPFNKGKHKIYQGVPGNLVAYGCRLSFQKGKDGFLSFHSKTRLIEHYEKSLGAYHFGGHLMIIDPKAAKLLVKKYFKS